MVNRLIFLLFPLSIIGKVNGDDPVFSPVKTAHLMGAPEKMPGYVHEAAFPNLTFKKPVRVTTMGQVSGHLAVATQEGFLYSFRNERGVQESNLMLDLSRSVAPAGGDNGFLDVAFHPSFPDRKEIYVVYISRTRPKATVISRFQVSGTNPYQVDRESEETLIRIEQPFNDHNAACLQFGLDGYLYLSLGDGGWNLENNHAQDLGTLLGCMLRIDVNTRDESKLYSIPPDNPYINTPKARPEIWAHGLRAPWRFSFDRRTGACWLGDNGQNIREEINLVRRKANYGWPLYEGSAPFDPATVIIRGKPVLDPNAGPRAIRSAESNQFTNPVVDYDHTIGRSVVGGLVYRGKAFPDLAGCYIYGDHGNGNIWALRYRDGKVLENRLIARTLVKITSFGEDEKGNLYFTSFDHRINQLRRADESETPRLPFPRLLSETGLFRSLEDMTPARGLIPYQVNVPLWSDGAEKIRYLALPSKNQVTYRNRGAWDFPIGTVFVKTFLLPTQPAKRVETRLFLRNRRGWTGYTYLWNDEQNDAHLIDGAINVEYEVATPAGLEKRSWYVPSRSDCVACHTRQAGFVLGMRTAQVNREEQLERFNRLGIFKEPIDVSPDRFPDWQSGEGDHSERARAYLDVNCAVCHTPPGFTKMDLRHDVPLEQMKILNAEPEKARLGSEESRIVRPGAPESSELFLRMGCRGPGQMPPLATSQIDHKALETIRQWIQALKPVSGEN